MTTHEQTLALLAAGGELFQRLAQVRDEFGPDDEDGLTMDEGWLSVDAALDKWRKALRDHAAD